MTWIISHSKGYNRLLTLFFLLLPITAFSDVSQEYPNIVALGYISPLASEEGLPTPLIIWKHQSSNHPGDATLDVFLETSAITAGFSYPLASDFQIGYQLSGTVISEGYGSDIYINGSRIKKKTFDGNSLMFNIFAKHPINNQWSIQAEVGRKSLWFEKTKFTDSKYNPPSDHIMDQNTVKMLYEGDIFSNKDTLILTLSNGYRSQWQNWGLDSKAASKKSFNQLQLKWENTYYQSKFGHLDTSFYTGTGTNLDIISGYRVGGMAGQYPVMGYYRNEFRVNDFVAFRFLQEIEFAKDRKLQVIMDLASFRRVNLDYLDTAPDTQTIGGMGIGYFYGIRSLKGLPIIFTYGEGLNVHKNSKEKHRRELSIAVAAAF